LKPAGLPNLGKARKVAPNRDGQPHLQTEHCQYWVVKIHLQDTHRGMSEPNHHHQLVCMSVPSHPRCQVKTAAIQCLHQ